MQLPSVGNTLVDSDLCGIRSTSRWTGVRPEWMTDVREPSARTIDAARKYVVSKSIPLGSRSDAIPVEMIVRDLS